MFCPGCGKQSRDEARYCDNCGRPLSGAAITTRGRPDYAALKQFLEPQTAKDVVLSFTRIEEIIGAPLPASAYNHRAWWGNEKAETTRAAQARMGRSGLCR